MNTRRGFTLVELLTTIAIIGLLIALLLPGVQNAREAARRSSCANNLKQIGLAIASFESSNSALPAGFTVSGSPTDPAWGWAVFVLPHLDQAPLFTQLNPAGRSLATVFKSGATATDVALLRTSIPTYRCPSDSAPALNTLSNFGAGHFPIATSNYVGNAGNDFLAGSPPCQNTLAASEFGPTNCCRTMTDVYSAPYVTTKLSPPKVADPGGVFFGSFGPTAATPGRGPLGVPVAGISDGLSNTIVAGERQAANLAAVWAGVGQANSVGLEAVTRTLGRPTHLNVVLPSSQNPDKAFSSAHPGGAQFVYADGAVRFITDSISITDLTSICNRRDRKIFNDL